MSLCGRGASVTPPGATTSSDICRVRCGPAGATGAEAWQIMLGEAQQRAAEAARAQIVADMASLPEAQGDAALQQLLVDVRSEERLVHSGPVDLSEEGVPPPSLQAVQEATAAAVSQAEAHHHVTVNAVNASEAQCPAPVKPRCDIARRRWHMRTHSSLRATGWLSACA
jgi:hypothetical protein